MPRRPPHLLDLSPNGLNPLPLAEALTRPERARYVALSAPSKDVLRLARVYKLDLQNVTPPPWLPELRHLRVVQCRAKMKTLPPALLALPRLEYLHLEDTGLESLDGLEKLKALRTITFGRTPVQDKKEHLEEIAERVGGKASSWTIKIEREGAKPKGDIAKLLAAGELEAQTNLQKVNLKGKTFEDLYVTHDLRGANLANTTWRRCDFQYARFAGANLSGALFEDCYFSALFGDGGTMGKAKAPGIRFVRCGGTLELSGADITGAKLLLESDTHLDLEKTKAPQIELSVAFCSEREHRIKAKGADLRGANVTFDITEDRRAEILAKPKSKFAWKTDHLKGAKTDKTTSVTYAQLGAKASPSTIDPKGKRAKALTTIAASNASLWALAIDAAEAAPWGGNENGDFDRAMDDESGPIKVGTSTGVLMEIGDCGWAEIWEVDRGVAIVYAHISVERAEREKALALRVAQWPPPKKVAKIGKVAVKSGLLALLLPYEKGAFPPAALKSKKPYRDSGGGRVLLPLPKGTYEIVSHDFGPPGIERYEDEVGRYYSCTRIVKV